jgi:hypothetical protein
MRSREDGKKWGQIIPSILVNLVILGVDSIRVVVVLPIFTSISLIALIYCCPIYLFIS